MFEIGNTLREARTRRGLDILECESATKIRAKYLRAMEEEQFDLMPSPAYVRGFLRTYAEYLDLDGRLMLDEYESRFEAVRPSDEGSPRLTGGRRERGGGGGGTPRKRRGRRSEAQLLWLAIGGVTGVALLVWMGVGGEAPQSDAPIPGPPSTEATTPTAPVTEAAEPARTTTTPAPADDARVRISVEGVESGSWVLVHGKNAGGPLLYVGTLAPGDSRSWTVGRSVWLRAGDPSGISVTVGSREVELDGGTGDFIVSRAGARRVSAG